ncbi:MAG: hypothetical protein RI945_162 [Candidatus Parcubacteria bacterium]|jgi:hypothetical protein
MIKKYFFFLSLVFFFTFFVSDRSLAVWNKYCDQSQYSANQTCSGSVIEANHFSDDFEVRGQDDPGDSLTFWGNFLDGNGWIDINNGIAVGIDPATGFAIINANKLWPNLIGSGTSNTYSVQTYVKDQDDAPSGNATYNIVLSYAPIILSAQIGATTIAPGATVPNGDVVTFTCSSTTNMTISPSVTPPTTFSVTNTGTYEYTGTFTNNDTTSHTYTVSCTNIGGSVSQEDFTFNTEGVPSITGDIHISNIVSSPNTVSTPINFDWNSDGNACSLYNYDRSINYGPATGTPDPARGSVPWAFTLSAGSAPSTSGTFGYYVKCIDSEYTARQAGPSPIETFGGISNVAWLKYDVVIGNGGSCPPGQEPDVNGYCHAPCGPGLTWDPTTLQCVTGSGCPSGQYLINGVCGTCPSNQVYNPSLGTCVAFSSNNASCQFTDTTFATVKIVNPPSCPVGATTFNVDYTNGPSQSLDPNGFAWENTQYQYRYTCNSQNIKIIKACVRPYTHFLVFNVSAGFVKKSSGIDISWTVEDPNDTCKIVATDINNGNVVLDTSSATGSPLYTNLTTGTMVSSLRAISSSSYKSITGNLFSINSSLRFVASCINSSAYNPGYYQLVRDVYVTNEKEN